MVELGFGEIVGLTYVTFSSKDLVSASQSFT
jgi:hypothetical protein